MSVTADWFCRTIRSLYTLPALTLTGSQGRSGVQQDDIVLPWHKSPSFPSVCAGGEQQGDEALSISVFGNAGKFLWGDRGDRSGASREDPPTHHTPTLSAYLRETTIGLCTLEQSKEAPESSQVWYAGGRRTKVCTLSGQDMVQHAT